MDDDALGGTGSDGFQVRSRIAFRVAVFGMLPRINLVKPHQHIMFDVRVGIFINSYSRSGVRTVYNDDAILNTAFFDIGYDFSGDVPQLIPFAGTDLHSVQHNVIPSLYNKYTIVYPKSNESN
ncbi:hypothetical protein D3C75_1102800 [compost metagenome]